MTELGRAQRELNLRQIGGPALPPTALLRAGPTLIGRSSQSDLHLEDPGVSRRHAELRPAEGGWILIDHSTHGTSVNGVRIDTGLAYPIAPGDQIRIGPWVFEVAGGEGAPPGSPQTILIDGGGTQTRRASLFDRSRLRALSELAELLTGARDDRAVAEALVAALLRGSQFEWGAIVRPGDGAGGGTPELIAGMSLPPDAAISRTLLAQAGEGLAILEPGSVTTPHSLIGTPTRSAAAASVGPWCAYVASSDAVVVDEACAAYLEVVSRLGALALSDRRRRDLELRHAQYRDELAAARRVQERFLPVLGRRMGGWMVDSVSAPGLGMAGDILGAVSHESETGGSLTVFIGDVVGKGSAASIVMTAAQSYLEARLRSGEAEPLTEVVASLNRFVAGRTLGAEFLTLWIGRIAGGRIEYVDAGHGYAHRFGSAEGVAGGTGGVLTLNAAGGIPVGIDAEAPYNAGAAPFQDDHTLLLCSDGVIEQRGRGGEEFSAARLHDLLAEHGRTITAGALLDRVRAFAGREGLDDDFTACIVRRAQEGA